MKNALSGFWGILILFILPRLVEAQIKFKVPNFINFNSIEDLVVGILNVLIIIAIPVIVLRIILAGFKYVTAQGNAAQIEEATRSLTYSVIGGVLVIGAVALSQIVANVVGAFTTP